MNFVAQDKEKKENTNKPDKFCYEMKNGKMMVMRNGLELMADYTTSKGVTIKPDGTVMKKDGTSMMMKEGECVDSEGKVHKKEMPKTKEPGK
jgi:hypothetical protein